MSELTPTQMWLAGGIAFLVWVVTSGYFKSVEIGLRREIRYARETAAKDLENQTKLQAAETERMKTDIAKAAADVYALALSQHTKNDHLQFRTEVIELIREQGKALHEAIKDLAATNKEAIAELRETRS